MPNGRRPRIKSDKSLLRAYFRETATCSNSDELCRESRSFLKKHCPDVPFALYIHNADDNPLRLIEDAGLKAGRDVFNRDDFPAASDAPFRYGDYCVNIIGNADRSLSFIIIMIRESHYKTIEKVLDAWKYADLICRNSAMNERREMENHFSRLISQMLHDVQSLIQLSDPGENAGLYNNKVAYQERAGNEILFFIREIELLQEEMDIRELMNSTIDLLKIEPGRINIQLDENVGNVYADAELFSRAVNAVIHNSLEAAGSNSVIHINIKKEDPGSPFIPFNWIMIEVKDSGPGILEDYLPLIKSPFFSTKRQTGAVGFGLANAEKIVRAHGGFLKIFPSADGGTCVRLYFPEKNKA